MFKSVGFHVFFEISEVSLLSLVPVWFIALCKLVSKHSIYIYHSLQGSI